MRIVLVTPAPPGSFTGNRATALRWARILTSLGHRTRVLQAYRRQDVEVLIALHARRSLASILEFARRHPRQPLIVALTGTDVYGDLQRLRRPWQALQLATRIVTLQPEALRVLPPRLRRKALTIFQSAVPLRHKGRPPRGDHFDVAVIGHLRPVKDPFRAALAARKLPKDSRVRVWHVGAALSPAMARRAGRETAINPRYTWLSALPPRKTRALLARCHVCVVSSRSEGGANVIAEALVDGVPVLASRVPGNVGMLGRDYPGYFPLGDTDALARLLWRMEQDLTFRQRLLQAAHARAPLFHPKREREAWRQLLCDLATSTPQPTTPAAS